MRRASLLALLLSACTSASTYAPMPRIVPSASLEQLFAEIGAGTRSLASHIDPTRGLIVIRSGLPDDAATERTFSAERVCGPALTALMNDLTAHIALTEQLRDVPTTCAVNECHESIVMEGDAERFFRFVVRAEGPLQLARVLFRDPLSPDHALHIGWEREVESRLADAPCGAAITTPPPRP